jgi:hypothetical protein
MKDGKSKQSKQDIKTERKYMKMKAMKDARNTVPQWIQVAGQRAKYRLIK